MIVSPCALWKEIATSARQEAGLLAMTILDWLINRSSAGATIPFLFSDII
jgi:hypothetical protein